METEFLNFYDEEQFSDFPLSSEQQTFRERPQDLLMRIVENDFDYMETHFDIANSDNLWNKKDEHNEDEDEMSISEISTISNIDSIKEDFAKVLTDWQEHIGYLQASDMDEYMDIIGLSMNGTDKRNFYTAESIVQDEQTMHTVESNFLIMKQENIGKEHSHSSQNILDVENTDKEYATEDNPHRKNDGFVAGDSTKMEIKEKSPLMKTKHSRNQSKLKKDTVTNMSANLIVKPKKKKKKKHVQCNKDIQNNDQDNNKRTNLPVLEAGDVKSLLEQFEASEDALVSTCPSTEMNIESELNSSAKSNETQQCIEQSQISNLHKDIRDALPKEVVEKIKTSARKKKVISIIPAMPSNNGRSNGTRMQDAAASLSRNKLLKIVTNNTKNKIIDGGLVQLDHDYCSINSSVNSGSESNTCEEQSSSSSNLNKSFVKKRDYLTDSNSKKESGLESGDVSDNNEEQPGITIVSDIQNNKSTKQLQNETKICRKEVATSEENCQRSNISNDISNCTSTSHNSKSQMKIHSALAANILRIRQGVVNKQDSKSIKVGTQRIKQMVSVLKKPLNVQASVVKTIPDENTIVTTDNGSHDKVNTTVQDSEKASTQEEEKKPPRKKLNLAEYRSRREQNRSDNSRTNSPLQPMTLVYVHHASTTTEPIKDDPKNLIWSEREIVSVLKPKLDTDEKKVRPKPITCDIAIQTYETVFEFPTKSLIDVDERFKQQRDNNARDKDQQSCRKHGIGSNSNRSKSRSKSKSKSRSRSRSRSSSNRSRSRKRNNTRQRRISHRRSSVSSSSSWSSRSHSHSHSRSHSRSRSRSHSHSRSRSRSHFRYRSRSRTRSSFSSESRYSRSRSRSSRSRSPSSSRYSSCSRSSSRSNFGRNKWSKRRKSNRRHYTSYDRHKQHSTTRYHNYRDWKRSPSTSYRRSCDNWYDREKQKQVEERRVIYVGRLDEGITKADLRRRFETFGPVVDISIHFREHGDNYGFVTFAYKNDAYEAVEHGNDDPALPRYDLCFGGRRAFCKVKYADLDGMASSSFNNGYMLQGGEDNTFDLLLKEAKAKLRKRNV